MGNNASQEVPNCYQACSNCGGDCPMCSCDKRDEHVIYIEKLTGGSISNIANNVQVTGRVSQYRGKDT